MNIGLSSFLFVYYSLGDAIRKTAEAGFDAIDIWGGRPHAYRADLAPEEMRELKVLLDQSHLQVASFIPAQFRYPTCLCSPNETIRKDSVAYILASAETAAALGAPVVSVCPGHTVYGQPKEDAWSRLEESLETICQHAGQHGLRVALEPADAYETDLMNTVSEAMTMVIELGFPNLGIVLVAFLFTFIAARILVIFNMAGKLPPQLFFHVQGTHVHHLNYGIILLSASGAFLIFARPSGRRLSAAAVFVLLRKINSVEVIK